MSSKSLSLKDPHGKRLLLVLCAVAFMDFVDASITNVALPHIRVALGFSVQTLQWVPSAYLLSYGGLMLLGGRLADLFGRRRVMVIGTALVAGASLVGGLANSSGLFVVARLVQGAGAALMLPAALATLTTSFTAPADRHRALGVWGAVAGLSSAVGVLVGGALVQGPGWRWVMFVNPIACALIMPAILAVVPAGRPATTRRRFDIAGSALVTGGMLLLVFALVRAPIQGWSAAATWLELGGAALLLGAFVLAERRVADPIMPLSTFRIRGLVAANVTGLVGYAGLLSMFFFLTLYMQTVLGYSPLATGAAYLPLTFAVGISAGIGAKLLTKVGTRPVIFTGALLASGGLLLLAQVPVNGSYVSDILPGLLVVSFGLGPVFVGVTAAANAGATADRAGLVAAILNATQQIGGALGLAILSALATSRTTDLLASGESARAAATSGFSRALLAGAVFAAAAAVIALRTVNTYEESPSAENGPAIERRVLVVGRSQIVLDTVLADLHGLGYHAQATNEFFSDIPARFPPKELDLVVFGGAVPLDRKAELTEQIAAENPQVIFLNGLAGIPGLIVKQIQGVFAAGQGEPVHPPTLDPDKRTIELRLAEPERVTVTAWWTTAPVPPDPQSDSLVLFDHDLPAGDHTVAIPGHIPDQGAFATVQVGAAVFALSIDAAAEGVARSDRAA
jgi:EmrB/QacA subfamily drug resistance transporter